MTPRAQEILDQVLAAMQAAEELSGVELMDDYIDLMDKIRVQAELRKVNCLAHNLAGQDLSVALGIKRAA